ncbi:LytR family transcriptional regulator [Leucobacter zeae]|nr:LytR family transcriptional regulator [Leucobacter zeae]
MAKKSAAEAECGGFVRHGRLRRSSSVKNALRVLVTAAIVVSLSGVATVAYAAWGLLSSVNTVDLGGGPAVEAGSSSLEGEVNILLIGSDTREGQKYNDGEEGELNDVNLLLHISADHQNATVVSFPRDLMIPFPSCPGPNGEPEYYPAMSEQQLNSAMTYGGLPCAVDTVEELTGMDIPYAAKITFDGVTAMSNAIGGVEVCLTQPIVDEATNLDLPAGMNTLVGDEALQFLRTRHGVGDGGDTSRISNQQVFMSAMVRKLKSAETLSDPLKVYRLAKAGVENMQLSTNMATVQFMQALAGTVKDIDLDRINFVQYPSANHPYQEGRLTPNYADAEVLFDILASGESFTVQATGEGVAVEGEDPATGDPTAEDPAATEAPATEAPATEEPATDPTTGEPAEDPAATTNPDGTRKLPPSITGQGAGTQTCSAGRTVL